MTLALLFPSNSLNVGDDGGEVAERRKKRKTMKCPSFSVITIALLLAMPATYAAPGHTKGRAVQPFTPALKPGDYAWHPEVSPAGPVVVYVSLSDQVLYVYRNGLRIGRSTVSTGKADKVTPTGVFTVLQKKVQHESSIYKGAQMPHMQRLTWTGIALHAGNLPGYPASAGCVRLPVDFAEKLYTVTSLGTTVIIAGGGPKSGQSTQPGLLFSGQTGPRPSGGFVWAPERAPKGPVSIIVSGADRAAYIYRNGVEIARAPVGGLERLSGSYAYSALATVDAGGRRDWISVIGSGGRAPKLKELANRISIAPDFLAKVRALIVPGITLVLTDTPVDASTRSARGFNIFTD
jgi:lipoprotein-anchoring transpeptidase ErfK/SrfK